jgi:ribonuclease P protein component
MKKTFPKQERLRYKPAISELFKIKKGEFSFPFKIVYIKNTFPEPTLPQVLITVPKKNFKKALDRNWIKRRIRELYRLHKTLLSNKDGLYSVKYIAIVYVAKEKISFRQMEKKITKLLPILRE